MHSVPPAQPLHTIDADATGTTCIVELYGDAQLVAGLPSVRIPLSGPTTVRDVIHLLARATPSLVGHALALDGSSLLEGYVLNLNGRDFLTDLGHPVRAGDRLLLLAGIGGGAGGVATVT
jgi:hypothetical protein